MANSLLCNALSVSLESIESTASSLQKKGKGAVEVFELGMGVAELAVLGEGEDAGVAVVGAPVVFVAVVFGGVLGDAEVGGEFEPEESTVGRAYGEEGIARVGRGAVLVVG